MVAGRCYLQKLETEQNTSLWHGSSVSVAFRKQLRQTTRDRQKVAQVLNQEYSSLGSIYWQEGITLAHFIVLIMLWLTKSPGRAGGWGSLFLDGYVKVDNITWSACSVNLHANTLIAVSPRNLRNKFVPAVMFCEVHVIVHQ